MDIVDPSTDDDGAGVFGEGDPEYEELRKVEPKGTAEYVIARTRGKRGGDTTENRNKRRKQQKQNKCEP